MSVHITTVLRPHGIVGKLKVFHFDEEIQQIVLKKPVSDGLVDYKVDRIDKLQSNFLILHIDGINSHGKALALVGKDLYIKREYLLHLRDDEYYTVDLIGTRVVFQDGSFYGTIMAVYNFGAGDIIEVGLQNNRTVMLTFTKDIFLSNDIQNKIAVIKLPEFIDE